MSVLVVLLVEMLVVDVVVGLRLLLWSFSHTKVRGKSPVTTTHCILVLSPTFKSRAKLKGVILGGTER